jgi:hypothetical protein
MDNTFYYKAVGEAIVFASIQFSIGSVEMSSKFSVMNFSKDQETLQNAAYALTDYLKIALLWIVGTSLIMYSNFGLYGLIVNVIINSVIVGWIMYSYHICFQHAAKKYKLKYPNWWVKLTKSC